MQGKEHSAGSSLELVERPRDVCLYSLSTLAKRACSADASLGLVSFGCREEGAAALNLLSTFCLNFTDTW